MTAWVPSSPLEHELQDAFREDDPARCWSLLQRTELALPLNAPMADSAPTPAWAIAADDERTWLLAFTSIETMTTCSKGAVTHARIVTLRELAAGWPDAQWGLAINPGLELSFRFDSGMVARLAAPPLATLLDVDPTFAPVMQQVLPAAEVPVLLEAAIGTVSGYCQFVWETEHIATPAVLVRALGLAPEESFINDATGSAFMLRWRLIGLVDYLEAYGGTTPAGRDAVSGQIVEEPPFVGLGFTPNVDQVIREFKVSQGGLPTGAELWELTVDGDYRRRAIYDRGARRWRQVARRDEVDPSAPRMALPRTAPAEQDGDR